MKAKEITHSQTIGLKRINNLDAMPKGIFTWMTYSSLCEAGCDSATRKELTDKMTHDVFESAFELVMNTRYDDIFNRVYDKVHEARSMIACDHVYEVMFNTTYDFVVGMNSSEDDDFFQVVVEAELERAFDSDEYDRMITDAIEAVGVNDTEFDSMFDAEMDKAVQAEMEAAIEYFTKVSTL